MFSISRPRLRLILNRRLRNANQRTLITIHLPLLSPSVTHTQITKIHVPHLAPVNCYDLLLSVECRNLTIFDTNDSEATKMVLECVDEGVCLFRPRDEHEMDSGDLIGLLAESDEEALIVEHYGGIKLDLDKFRNDGGNTTEWLWEAYLA